LFYILDKQKALLNMKIPPLLDNQ